VVGALLADAVDTQPAVALPYTGAQSS